MPPGTHFWYHPTLTIYKSGGTWQSSSGTIVHSSTDVVPESSKQPGLDGRMWRYCLFKDVLYMPSDAVWQEILNAGFTPQPIPAGRRWTGTFSDCDGPAGSYPNIGFP